MNKVSKSKQQEAMKRMEERNHDLYKCFQAGFSEKIASSSESDGLSRIQMLEQMLHSMNSDIIASNLKYAGDMIETLNEDEIIESKKVNS